MNYCSGCDYADKCVFAYQTMFCDDCKDSDICGVRGVSCKAGHDIECNNGFEDKNDYCSED